MPELSKNHVSKMTPRGFISVELSLPEIPVKHKRTRFQRLIGPEIGLVVLLPLAVSTHIKTGNLSEWGADPTP